MDSLRFPNSQGTAGFDSYCGGWRLWIHCLDIPNDCWPTRSVNIMNNQPGSQTKRSLLFQSKTRNDELNITVSIGCLAQSAVLCSSCADTCHVNAIQFDAGRFYKPSINNSLCDGCGDCVSICPVGAIKLTKLTTKNESTNDR